MRQGKAPPGAVSLLSVWTPIERDGENYRRTWLSLSSRSQSLRERHRPVLPLLLQNPSVLMPKIFPLPSRLAALPRSGARKSPAW